MKITKLLITSLAFLTVGAVTLFAAENGAVVDESEASDTTSTTTLDSTTGNPNDNVKIIGSVESQPLVTSLYYNTTNITNDSATEPTYIYDADWNVQSGFETDSFSVAIKGSTGQEADKQLNVEITASPFKLSGNESVHAGNVTITKKFGATDGTASAISATPGENVTLPIDSATLSTNTYYDGLLTPNSVIGQESGKVASFTIKAEPLNDRALPSGRYVSTVTLAYSIQ